MRIDRVNDEILKETANIIRNELSDPRLDALTSVVRVNTSTDLKYCKIYISVYADDNKKQEVMEGLKNATGYIRRLLAHRINLRITPELSFVLDESLEQSYKLQKIIDEVMKPSQKDD